MGGKTGVSSAFGDSFSTTMNTMLLCVAILFGAAVGSPSADQVASLPGYGAPPSRHFSGFLSVGSKNMHYYFVESERSPSTDPVVLWLNGGPGCSSLDGLFYEQGPLLVSPDGETLVKNNNSWATIANMLYLEAPCGVGFSYSRNKSDYRNDDVGTAKDNLAALKEFFRSFPEFKPNEFYVSGESYAGVYVPTLSQQIFESASTNQINMKGFLVGNGCFDSKIQGSSDFGYLWGHGLIPNNLYAKIQSTCKDVTTPTQPCSELLRQAESLTSGVNIYSTYGDCYSDQATPQAPFGSMFDYKVRWSSMAGNLGRQHARRPAHPSVVSAMGLQQVQGMVPCIDSSGGEKYLNRADVRAALHVTGSS